MVGDVILLSGDLGCGKTTFSRGFVRGLTQEPEATVTSPSYLLDNCYNVIGPDDVMYDIHHMDLYRLPTNCDLTMLGIPEIFETSICLIEWPERMGDKLPKEYVRIDFSIDEHSNSRKLSFCGSSEKWKQHLIEFQKDK